MKKFWKMTTLAAIGALAAVCVGSGVGAVTQADAEITEGSVVSVTIGNETTGYDNLGSAMMAANAAESAKITLLTDVDVGGVSYDVNKAITLDLAGYVLSNTCFPMSYDVSSLVIEDSSEKKTGEVFPRTGVVFTTIYKGSVTINGGTFHSADLTIVSGNTDGTVTINGGTFEGYTVFEAETGEITVNGGTFNYVILKESGGEISVKGGEFSDIDVRKGFTFADSLADGYALKDSADEYVDIYQTYIVGDTFTVVEHICDLTKKQYNDSVHWAACDCYRRPEDGVEEAHTLGIEYDIDGHWDGCDCGYRENIASHEVSEWTEFIAATETERGVWQQPCKCGYAKVKTVSATETRVVELQADVVVDIYPDKYVFTKWDSSYREEAFEGKYIFVGKQTTNLTFHVGDDGLLAEYDVTFHNFTAMARDWHGMFGVARGVTLNITATGVNEIYAYNHPAVSRSEGIDDEQAIVNLTLDENSSITFGRMYDDQSVRAFDSNILFTLVNGAPNFELIEGWQSNDTDLTVTKGEPKSHTTNYTYVDETYCKYVCTEEGCSVETKLAHKLTATKLDEENADCAVKHSLVCEYCTTVLSTEEHNYGRIKIDEEYCVPYCYDCEYVDEANKSAHVPQEYYAATCTRQAYCGNCRDSYGTLAAHVFGEDDVCTECGKSATFELTVGEKTERIVDLSEVEYRMSGDAAITVKALVDIQSEDLYLNTGDVTIDLAGFTWTNADIDFSGDSKLTIIDSSEEKTGILTGEYSYLYITENASGAIYGGTYEAYFHLDTTGTISLYGGTYNTSGFGYYDEEKYLPYDCYVFADEEGAPIVAATTIGEKVQVIHVDSYGIRFDANGHWAECLCGLTTESVAHTLGSKYDNSGHFTGCDCGYAIDKEEHVYGEWVVTKEATEKSAGEKEKGCECGHTVKETIPALSAGKKDKDDEGCGGVVGGAALGVIALAGAAMLIRKKKED